MDMQVTWSGPGVLNPWIHESKEYVASLIGLYKNNGAVSCVTINFLFIWSLYRVYRNLPNKGAGRSNKGSSDRLKRKLRFPAFQRWFRIENRTIIKEAMSILAIYGSIGLLQTKGAPLLGEAPLIGRLR